MVHSMENINGLNVVAEKSEYVKLIISEVSKYSEFKKLILFGHIFNEECPSWEGVYYVVIGDVSELNGFQILDEIEKKNYASRLGNTERYYYYDSNNWSVQDIMEDRLDWGEGKIIWER